MRQRSIPPIPVPDILDVARRAGDEIMRIYETAEVLVARKDDDSPLTAADLASHRHIARELGRRTPALPVVSEEDADSGQHRRPDGEFWLIDPLDGTREFIARNGEFTVNIALIRQGRPCFGVVYAPALRQMYWGGAGFGAWRTRDDGAAEAIQVATETAPGAPLRVVASKSHLNADTQAFIECLGAVTLVQAGSSLKFCKVAEGSADLYPRLAPTCEWDTAAAQAVLEGAGGVVVDRGGSPLRYGKPEILNPPFIAAQSTAIIPA